MDPILRDPIITVGGYEQINVHSNSILSKGLLNHKKLANKLSKWSPLPSLEILLSTLVPWPKLSRTMLTEKQNFPFRTISCYNECESDCDFFPFESLTNVLHNGQAYFSHNVLALRAAIQKLVQIRNVHPIRRDPIYSKFMDIAKFRSISPMDTKLSGTRSITEVLAHNFKSACNLTGKIDTMRDKRDLESSAVVVLPCSGKDDLNQQMADRKQRSINKHSKKRKRRLKKKSKVSSLPSCSIKKENQSNEVKPEKFNQAHPVYSHFTYPSDKNGTLHCNGEESDDDLCIVFEDDDPVSYLCENDKPCSSFDGISDLWIGFDALAMIPSENEEARNSSCHAADFFIQCGSDSENETDSTGVTFDINVDEEFGFWPGLFFVSSNTIGHSDPKVGTHHLSIVSRTCLYDPVLVTDNDGTSDIQQVNKRWQELTCDVDKQPRLPIRVAFAPDEDLVAIFPVDVVDRKGEWEQYATARFRFKRRVDEFEKVVSPYFAPAHREAVLRRMKAVAS